MLRRQKSGDAAKKPKPKKEKKPKAKKAKPARKAKPREGVVLQKQPTNIYTVMLMISLAAILLACIMLWLELSSYGSFPQWKT